MKMIDSTKWDYFILFIFLSIFSIGFFFFLFWVLKWMGCTYISYTGHKDMKLLLLLLLYKMVLLVCLLAVSNVYFLKQFVIVQQQDAVYLPLPHPPTQTHHALLHKGIHNQRLSVQ